MAKQAKVKNAGARRQAAPIMSIVKGSNRKAVTKAVKSASKKVIRYAGAKPGLKQQAVKQARKKLLAASHAMPKKSAPKKTVTMQRGAGKPRVTVRARLSESYRGARLAAATCGGGPPDCLKVELFPFPTREEVAEVVLPAPVRPPPVPELRNIPAGTLFCFRNPKGSVDLGLLREEMPSDVTTLTLWLGQLPPGSVPAGQSDQVFKTIQMSQVISRVEMKD